VAISLHEACVGVFVPYLENLSGLLDRASAHAPMESCAGVDIAKKDFLGPPR